MWLIKSRLMPSLRNSPDILLKTLEENDGKGIDNLATSLCGWTSVMSLLYMTEGRKDVTYKADPIQNSGDSELMAIRTGWLAIIRLSLKNNACQERQGFSLNEQEKATCLK